jgi:hypothetical protein
MAMIGSLLGAVGRDDVVRAGRLEAAYYRMPRRIRVASQASTFRSSRESVPAHCTGINTIIAINRELPAKLVMPSTGTRIVFGA